MAAQRNNNEPAQPPDQNGQRPVPALHGVRVLDFSRLLPGAYCTWLLASLGAEVIKVEQPGKGDYQRDIGLQAGPRGSALFQLVNQGKRSLALDLKQPQSQPILKRLLDRADIIVESFRPGVAKRLGIDFDGLRADRPALVCVSISGFGSNSPLRSMAAHDINYLALSGLLHRSIAAGDGIPELPLADLIGGGLVPAMNAIALIYRARSTGVGGVVDASLADAVPLLPYGVLAAQLLDQPEPSREDSEFSGAAPHYRVYQLRDGYVAVGAVEEQFWTALCKKLNLPATIDISARWGNETVAAEIARRFGMMTREQTEALFHSEDACVTVVKAYNEIMNSPHARAREFTAAAPMAGTMPRLGSPFFHDGHRQFADGAAPLIGEHSTQVLSELGYSGSEIETIAKSGAVTLAFEDTLIR